MHTGGIPVFPVHHTGSPVQIQLVHPEGYRDIFGHPLFYIGIAVNHPQFSHNGPAGGIIHIVGSGDKGNAIGF